MKKVLGVALVLFALVIGIVPLFTDCLSQGRSLTTTTNMKVPMKCHWTAIAEAASAVPLGLAGILSIFNKRKESLISNSVLGIVLGGLSVAFPTVLIGVCANNAMLCNMIMKPTLIASGTLAVIACAVVLVSALRSSAGPLQISGTPA